MREIRSSRSVEGVVSNHDPYSDCRTGQTDAATGELNFTGSL